MCAPATSAIAHTSINHDFLTHCVTAAIAAKLFAVAVGKTLIASSDTVSSTRVPTGRAVSVVVRGQEARAFEEIVVPTSCKARKDRF